LKFIQKKAANAGMTLEEACAAVGVSDPTRITVDGFDALKTYFVERGV
jgi:hypothetical protein